MSAAEGRSTGQHGPRSTNDRLRRLLVMLPWLMERGQARVSEVADRFELTESQLVADLELVALCGLPPFQDELVDLYIDEGMVYVGVPRLFTKPLRLTAPEGFALLAAARSAMEMPGADGHGALARALEKLAAVLGDDGVVVDLRRPPLADTIADAVATGERLDVVYWTTSREDRTERRITPRAVFHDRGRWYVVADDHLRGDERVFRIDRVESVEHTGVLDPLRPIALPDAPAWFDDEAVERAALRVRPPARWMFERDPVDRVEEHADGSATITVPVASEAWLGRLLLRAGGDVEVLDPQPWRDLGARLARATLRRYERNGESDAADSTR